MSEWHISLGIGEHWGSYLSWGYGYSWLKRILRSMLQILRNSLVLTVSIDEMKLSLLQNNLILGLVRRDQSLRLTKVEMVLGIKRVDMKLELLI